MHEIQKRPHWLLNLLSRRPSPLCSGETSLLGQACLSPQHAGLHKINSGSCPHLVKHGVLKVRKLCCKATGGYCNALGNNDRKHHGSRQYGSRNMKNAWGTQGRYYFLFRIEAAFTRRISRKKEAVWEQFSPRWA